MSKVINVDFKNKKVWDSNNEEILILIEEKTKSTFEEITKKNKENEERIKKERAKDNVKVMKSYRIKWYFIWLTPLIKE